MAVRTLLPLGILLSSDAWATCPWSGAGPLLVERAGSSVIVVDNIRYNLAAARRADVLTEILEACGEDEAVVEVEMWQADKAGDDSYRKQIGDAVRREVFRLLGPAGFVDDGRLRREISDAQRMAFSQDEADETMAHLVGILRGTRYGPSGRYGPGRFLPMEDPGALRAAAELAEAAEDPFAPLLRAMSIGETVDAWWHATEDAWMGTPRDTPSARRLQSLAEVLRHGEWCPSALAGREHELVAMALSVDVDVRRLAVSTARALSGERNCAPPTGS